MVGTTKAVDRMAKKPTAQKLWKLTSSRKSPRAKNMRSCAFRFPLLCSNCGDANSSSVPFELVTLPYKHKIHVRQILGKLVNFHPVKPLARSCSARRVIIPDRITPEYQFIVVIENHHVVAEVYLHHSLARYSLALLLCTVYKIFLCWLPSWVGRSGGKSWWYGRPLFQVSNFLRDPLGPCTTTHQFREWLKIELGIRNLHIVVAWCVKEIIKLIFGRFKEIRDSGQSSFFCWGHNDVSLSRDECLCLPPQS